MLWLAARCAALGTGSEVERGANRARVAKASNICVVAETFAHAMDYCRKSDCGSNVD